MEASIQSSSESAEVILSRVVSEAKREGEKTICHFNDGGSILLSNFLGALIRPGDEINFPLPTDSAGAGTEIYIRKASSAGRGRDLYQAPISYAAQPKADKRERLYVRAEVPTRPAGHFLHPSALRGGPRLFLRRHTATALGTPDESV